MDIRMNKTHIFGVALVLLIIFSLIINCGKPVPVKELTDARAEIEEASRVEAENYSAENFKSARETLLAAHQLLVDEKMPESKKKANEARDLGLLAREESSPKFTAREKQKTEDTLKDADEAYAGVLAKDDFQSARKLFLDGVNLKQKGDNDKPKVDALKKEAGTLKGKANAADRIEAIFAKRHAIIRQYSNADLKFQAARVAAKRAKYVALGQKDDLLDSLSGVESMLRRAEQYQADKIVPELYNSARNEVKTARKQLTEGKLKKGNTSILRAEHLAKATLNSVMEKYAARKKAEATTAVNNSEQELNKETASIEDEKLKQKISRTREQLEAAKEALTSAEKNYSDRKYDDSIKDSEEAIRLAKIVNEQVARLKEEIAVVVRKRDIKIDPNKKTDGTDKTEISRKGWKKYVVKRRTPVECLWNIAKYKFHYNNPLLWKLIYQANKKIIKNPNLIYPGQILWIPPKNYKFKKGDKIPPDEKKDEPDDKPADDKKDDTSTDDKPADDKKDDTQPRENVD